MSEKIILNGIKTSEEKMKKALSGEKGITLNMNDNYKLCMEIYNRGYKVDGVNFQLLVEAIEKLSKDTDFDMPLIDKVCAILDSEGLKEEDSVKFGKRYYRESDVKRALEIAKTPTAVDGDKLVTFLRKVLKDLMDADITLTDAQVMSYMKSHAKLVEQKENREKMENVSFCGRTYNKEQLKQLYLVALTPSKIKDPDDIVNIMRDLIIPSLLEQEIEPTFESVVAGIRVYLEEQSMGEQGKSK